MINFVDAGRNKNFRYSWEAFKDRGGKLGFLRATTFLNEPGGVLCTFLDLSIGPSIFVMFHI